MIVYGDRIGDINNIYTLVGIRPINIISLISTNVSIPLTHILGFYFKKYNNN